MTSVSFRSDRGPVLAAIMLSAGLVALDERCRARGPRAGALLLMPRRSDRLTFEEPPTAATSAAGSGVIGIGYNGRPGMIPTGARRAREAWNGDRSC
ncbi:hypothetical protein ACFFMM_24135 [Micromonospora chaiyaphumensis]|uniref:hypothetical protein n=1 Tax=Micromonospora chaiyaphumensis TaxID=307119 RepID=UPI00111311CC|nr:hypothetical protein [Micromonospora chaiyaphumensis]